MATRFTLTSDRFIRENEELRARLAEAECKLAEARELIRTLQPASPDNLTVGGPRPFMLKGGEEDYRALLEVMNEGAATLDAKGTVLYCNQRLCDLLGIELQHIIGNSVTKFVEPDKRHLLEVLLVEARSGKPSFTELEFQCGRSNPVPVSVSLRQIRAAEPPTMCMVFTDLTEHKQQDELIAAGRLSALILDSAAEAIAVCDEAGTIIAGNEALQKLCAGNPFFQPFDDALPLVLAEGSSRMGKLFSIADALSGITLRAQEVRYHRGEQTITLLLTSAPVKDSSGIVGCVLTMTDITQRKQAEKELRLANERFQVALRGSPICVYNQDLDLRYTWVYNPPMGFRSSEMIGKRIGELIERREDAERCEAIKREVIRTGMSRREEIMIYWQGEERYFDLLVDPLHGADGTIAGVTCAAVEITKRRLAEKTLRQSEARFRSVLDSSRDIIYRLNVQTGRYEYISPSAHSVVGSIFDELDDVDIESSLAMIHPDDLQAMRDFVARLEETGEGELVYRQRTRSGEYRWMSNRASLIRDQAGRPLYRNGNIRDITERKQAEDALRESENLFRTLADAIPQLCWMANVDGGIFWYNERFYQYTGTTPEQMEGWGWQSLHDPAVLPEVLERWNNSIATGEPLDMVFRLRGADGIYRPFLTRVMPVKDSSGRVVRWFGTNTDISEQKAVEEALRNSERLYRAIGEAIPYGVWVCDPEGRNTYTSESFLKLIGMTQQELSQFGFTRVLHPEDAQRVIPGWKECIRTGAIWDSESRLRGVDGKWHPILSRGVPVRDDRGQIVCWTGINLDIFRLKEAERALVRSEKLASVGRMASTIAHEINNPLETIGNVVYLAMTDPSMPDAAKEHLEIAVQELERINHITRQTLAFHRETASPMPIDLRTSVDTVLRLFEARLRSRGITVKRRYRGSGCIMAFSGEIQQVISNLLSNAMDATPERGRIEFRLSCAGEGRTRFTIADTGSGISRERLAKIFEPFFTTKEMYGTGLGLWVTRQIVEKHGGNIRVRSKLGRGTVFSMVFPVAEVALRR